ncbi:MAG: GDP-mannose 4,6-dehydratase [Candidatus Peribacteraceae bacterium]|jgi:GDPmannose 4,6-dehydratase|nr:GDP-mannose 4,6-dehydratase [Candidatus Peribacteraceae bacterium]
MSSNALILGITGQDGAYLSNVLLKKGYTVSGLSRHTGTKECWRLDELGIRSDVELIEGDIQDASLIEETIKQLKPQEIYNLAAQSVSANVSFENPTETEETNLGGVEHILESIQKHSPDSRLFQASSSEMYGESTSATQSEKTPLSPINPYGESKAEAHMLVAKYRNNGLYTCSGILFNHESPLRGEKYVSRKITDGVARIKLGLADSITLGNLDAKRDWGFAGDYVEAMWLMLQQDTPQDFVISTGQTHSLREMLAIAFDHIEVDEWEAYIQQDERFMRASELPQLCGDSSKAHSILNWEPRVSFEDMVRMMVDADITRLQQ